MANTYYNLKGHDIYVGMPDELNMEFDAAQSSDTVFTFVGEQCSISFIAQEKHCTQEEITATTTDCIKQLQMDTSTAEDVTLYPLNGSGKFVIGTHQQNSNVQVATGAVASLFTEQTLFVMATFTCNTSLVGQILGGIAFKTTDNFYSFDDYDVLVRFPDELKLKLDEESCDAQNAGFIGDGTECIMHFNVLNEVGTEEEIHAACMDYLAKVNVRESTISKEECATINGKAYIMGGLRDDDSGACLMIAFVTSAISEQTVVIRSTYGCDHLLIGMAVGATTFNK
ncbi:MAG: hypothetical protein II075_11390 [Bacteroidales bacterium]|nr:hypothetical protein [Bacteroidales bacterium]